MPNRRVRSMAVLALSASVAACTPGGNLPPMPAYRTSAYRLGAGDQIRIVTFGADQLGGQFNVDDKGRIALPLIGAVDASGLAPDELAARVRDRLQAGGFMRNPSVSVEVLLYRPIFILGEVVKPGQYPFQPGMTMLTAVAVAGGFTYRAVEDYAGDVRTTGDGAVEGKIGPSSLLAPGDVVKVYERHF